MIYNVKVEDKDYQIEISENSNHLIVRNNGREIKLGSYQLSGGRLSLLLQDNKPYEFQISPNDTAYECWLDSRLSHCEVISEKQARYAKLAGNNVGKGKAAVLKAPMPGLILKIQVEQGQKVKKGDGLVIVEAMKMENELRAGHAGVIKEIKVNAGDAVEKNQLLLTFE